MKALLITLIALFTLALMCFLIPGFAGALIIIGFIFFVIFAIGFFLQNGGFIFF